MHSFLRRAMCALLCLCLLLPTFALAEQPDATGLRFDLAFQMDPETFPEEQRSVMSGIADLMNILTLRGTLDQSFTGCFDLNTEWMLAGEEETRTSLRLYGMESCWGIESNLLGDEMLMVNMIALLEFSMKAYFHLDIPLQKLTLLVSPYVHTSALDALTSAWRQIMLAKEGKRTISRKNVLSLAQEMADIAESDRTFQYWVKALALDAGYDEAIMEFMASLPEWVGSIVSTKGISVTFKGATETWQTGETTLFTRTVEDSVTAWSLTLPTTANGYDLSAYYHGQPNGEHTLYILVTDEYQETLLDCTVKADNIPDLTSEVPIASPFTLMVDATGEALREELHLRFAGEGQDGWFTLSMLEPVTNAPQLTLSGMLEPYIPETVPHFTSEQMSTGMNLLSMNDVTLTELLGKISSPLYHGALPLLVHMPASSVQSILDLLTEHRVISLLVNGGASSAEEEYFD